ncbi:Alpha/beta hydrolase family protein [Planctomycetes bacterium Pla163]|uniref:Alpha/beta hydrolase family protein n=1 Tax=Rohdeia mirabilis TaxID=2528008 RepID=A0A518D1F0_9BACT|nr:Alpha/beta hydrolase family protein [Planctomycetes bacterium Pla163]
MGAAPTIILPGMGATSDMYRGPWRALARARFVDWPEHHGERTLRAIAERLVEREGITAVDVIVGSSLGGMVALEIGALVGARAVALIGSARQASEVQPFLRLIAPLATVAPIGLAQLLAGKSGGDVAALAAGADPGFVRAMCRAVADWPGVNFAGPVVRVHGARDLVIPCPDDAVAIAGAGHLVGWTHAEACVEALRVELGQHGIEI